MGGRRVGYRRDVEAVILEGRVGEGMCGGCANMASVRVVDGLTGTHGAIMVVGVVFGLNDDCPADGKGTRMVSVELVTLEKEPAEYGLDSKCLPIWQVNS